MCPGPGGKLASVTRPFPSVTPSHPGAFLRNGDGAGGAGTLGATAILTPDAGPRGDVTWNVAGPPITSGVSTVPLADTRTVRDAVSHTPAHRSTASVDTRYCPAASRSNVARPVAVVRSGRSASGDRGRGSS